jgi:hypothetical protein
MRKSMMMGELVGPEIVLLPSTMVRVNTGALTSKGIVASYLKKDQFILFLMNALENVFVPGFLIRQQKT